MADLGFFPPPPPGVFDPNIPAITDPYAANYETPAVLPDPLAPVDPPPVIAVPASPDPVVAAAPSPLEVITDVCVALHMFSSDLERTYGWPVDTASLSRSPLSLTPCPAHVTFSIAQAIAPSASNEVVTETNEFVTDVDGTTSTDGGSLNWFMIIVVAVVAVLAIVFSLYIMIIYQHPEDKNQAWFPKIVVIFGMTIAIYTVLMFPLDVTNSQVCSTTLPLVDCSTTFPMDILWQIVYLANIITVFVLVPFAFFYYEGDSEWSGGRKLLSAFLWTLGIVVIVIVVIGIPYILAGYATYIFQPATSGTYSVSVLSTPANEQLSSCIPVRDDNVDVGSNACAASSSREGSLRVRVSLITYAMAIVATIGWLLFLVFAAIGMVALPLDWIRQFISRPRTTITKKQYIERAKDLARRAHDIQFVAEALKKDRRLNGRSRKWRKNFSAVQSQVQVLMEDNDQLERVYPQGEDPAASWVMTVMGYWLKLFAGVAALALTICWILQVILYVLIDPPVSPFLNDAFIAANDVFALFGTILFGLFVFYLQGAVIKGNFKFGLNFLLFRVHPIKRGATVMSSMLFNVALVLLATTATIQFCAQAFALYAGKSAVYGVFGVTLSNLDGLKYLYIENIFIYAMLGVMLLTLLVLLLRGPDRWKKKKVETSFYDM